MGSPPSPENKAKDAESGDEEERFKSLAKGLFGVSREALAEQEQRSRKNAKKPQRPA
jgi:hypothetical protein